MKFTDYVKDVTVNILPEGIEPEERIVATNKTIRKIVRGEIDKLGPNADLNHIDVSNVTDMTDMFRVSKFNGDISQWDVINVTNMRYMFHESKFDCDISGWDVSNVKDMSYMFAGSDFNGNLRKWNVKRR